MNAHVRKEIRLLLPAFTVACASALANLCLPFQADGLNSLWYVLPFVACPACILMMALGSFGAEMDSGTFAMLLTQPVPRQKTWNLKLSLLALAFLAVGLMWCVCWAVQARSHDELIHWGDLLTTVGLIGLVIFSGGLWTVLLLRQVAAAFWFTVLTPGILAGLLETLCDWGSMEGAHFATRILEGGLLLYSVAGILFARRLFLRAQDIQWTGGTIALPRFGGRAKARSDAEQRRAWRPCAALVFKELQLHESQFIAAGVLALAHLSIVALKTFGTIHKNSTWGFVTESFWWLWLAMPLLVGCAAAAEERKLGTMGAQLCLPIRRRTQFAIKLGAVLALSVLFGALMPALFELSWTGPAAHDIFKHAAALPGINLPARHTYLIYDLMRLRLLADLLVLPAIAAGIGLVAFYGSTLSRNTLQSLGPAILGVVLLVFLGSVADDPALFLKPVAHEDFSHLLWHGPLIYLIATPVLTLALMALSHRNWQCIQVGRRTVIANLLALLGTALFIVVATTATYHRAWEKLMPFESSHGPARLALKNPATIICNPSAFRVQPQDGRIWTGNFGTQRPAYSWVTGKFLTQTFQPWTVGRWADSSGWRQLASGMFGGDAGVKTDGSLWFLPRPIHYANHGQMRWMDATHGQLIRYGTETNWSYIVSDGDSSYWLVKRDGTLWRWTTENWEGLAGTSPGLQASDPQRLGTDTNWAEAFQLSDVNGVWLRKIDGSLWTTKFYQDGTESKRRSTPDLSLWRAPAFEPENWRSLIVKDPSDVYSVPGNALAILNDGTFRLLAATPTKGLFSWQRLNLQLGSETNWLAVAESHFQSTGFPEPPKVLPIVTLANDGTLWLWPMRSHFRSDSIDPPATLQAIKPTRLGSHSDWIAIVGVDHGIVSLAADGSLWYWLLDDDGSIWSASLIEPSRRPQYLGNLFAKEGSQSSPRQETAIYQGAL